MDLLTKFLDSGHTLVIAVRNLVIFCGGHKWMTPKENVVSAYCKTLSETESRNSGLGNNVGNETYNT